LKNSPCPRAIGLKALPRAVCGEGDSYPRGVLGDAESSFSGAEEMRTGYILLSLWILALFACAPTKVIIYPTETRPERTLPAESSFDKTSPKRNLETRGVSWKLYATTDEASYYYDAESITHSSENIVEVSVKLHFTDRGILQMVEEFGERYQNLSEEIESYEINCSEKKFRILSVTRTSKEGEVILRVSRGAAAWTSIPKDSTSEILCEAVSR
jgi:hypothetical protein